MARRKAFTLLELCVVLAALIVLGAVFVPTIAAFRGNTRVKAAADTVRGRMAEARMKAMEDGQSYRVALSADGRRLRVCPDTVDALGRAAPSGEGASGPFIREDDLPEQVTAELMASEDSFVAEDGNGWKRVATFQPDGTCREDTVEVLLKELGVTPLLVRLRGLTGASSVEKNTANLGAAP